MITLNPQYEAIFKMNHIIHPTSDIKHRSEHYCYFDDMYSPEYTMQWICEAIRKAAIKREECQVTTCAFPSVSRLNEVKHDIDAESQALLVDGHKEILQSECYEDYGYPSYIEG